MQCSKEKLAVALSKVFEAEHDGGNYVGLTRDTRRGEKELLIDGTFDMLRIAEKVLDTLKIKPTPPQPPFPSTPMTRCELYTRARNAIATYYVRNAVGFSDREARRATFLALSDRELATVVAGRTLKEWGADYNVGKMALNSLHVFALSHGLTVRAR